MSSKSIWKAVRIGWIDVYVRPPALITYVAANSMFSNEFRREAKLMMIEANPLPVEAASSPSFVESYHSPLRREHRFIRKNTPGMDKVSSLQTAEKSMNDSNGLVPTLLVYGTLPRLGLPIHKPIPGTYESAQTVAKATSEISRYFAIRQVRVALRARNRRNVQTIHETPLGTHILVNRRKEKSWDEPFKLLNREGETCRVLSPQGSEGFEQQHVKLTLKVPGT